MKAICELNELLKFMEPELVDGQYVFVTSKEQCLVENSVAMIKEAEGMSYVLSKDEAERQSLSFDFIASWIVLRVHSSLNAVGLTAAVSTALTNAGISCNVIAGYYHDHLFVPHEKRGQAIEILKQLTRTEIASIINESHSHLVSA